MVIQGGCIITEHGKEFGDIRIKNGVIEEINTQISPHPGEVTEDADNCLVIPGGIDVHTHFDMPAAQCKTIDDFYTGTRAAIAGGTTTIIDFAEPDMGAPLKQGLDTWHQKADLHSFCDYGFHMTVSKWDESMEGQMRSMMDQGVTSFKAYTAYRDSIGVSLEELEEIMKAASKLGALVCVHCEDDDLLNELQGTLQKEAPGCVKSHPLSRPNRVEQRAVECVSALATKHKAPLYIVHLSASEGLEAVRKAKGKSNIIYAETCPHYLLLDESRYDLPGFEGARYVMSPPLRSLKDQEAMWDGLRRGVIDTVSTDHCAFCYKGQKELGLTDFTRIPNGIPSVEHRIELMYHYGMINGLGPREIAELTSGNPARIFGLYPQKGALREGSDADIVIMEHQPDYRIRKENLYHPADYTPYEGMAVSQRIRSVYLRGVKVVEGGLIITERPGGRFLRRG